MEAQSIVQKQEARPAWKTISDRAAHRELSWMAIGSRSSPSRCTTHVWHIAPNRSKALKSLWGILAQRVSLHSKRAHESSARITIPLPCVGGTREEGSSQHRTFAAHPASDYRVKKREVDGPSTNERCGRNTLAGRIMEFVRRTEHKTNVQSGTMIVSCLQFISLALQVHQVSALSTYFCRRHFFR